MIDKNLPSPKRYKVMSEILGEDQFKTSLDSSFDFFAVAEEGLEGYSIKNFKEAFPITLDRVASILDTSGPTLYRRLKSPKKLSKNESVKLLEVTDLFLYGVEVFGSKTNFFKWLDLPNTALGGMQPMDLVELPNGSSKVMDLLGRIEHGIYN